MNWSRWRAEKEKPGPVIFPPAGAGLILMVRKVLAVVFPSVAEITDDRLGARVPEKVPKSHEALGEVCHPETRGRSNALCVKDR